MMNEKKKPKELAIKVIWLTESSFKRWRRIAGRDYPELTGNEVANKFMDTHEREARLEEIGED